jgi:protein-L-isoaspartate(D-aspartate) O-methyltransferase
MDDLHTASRLDMVEVQLKRRGISDPRLLNAFARVPRHEFVTQELAARAYSDNPLPIGEGQTISQPYMVAVMTQAAAVQPGDKVLELGTGSGYQTAILLEMGAQVCSIERIITLCRQAEERLSRLGYRGWLLICADGTRGWPEQAPFDIILVAAGAPDIPTPLLEQLKMGGRLVIPVEEDISQVLYVVTRTEQGFERKRGERCTFVPLIGEHGWHGDPR